MKTKPNTKNLQELPRGCGDDLQGPAQGVRAQRLPGSIATSGRQVRPEPARGAVSGAEC